MDPKVFKLYYVSEKQLYEVLYKSCPVIVALFFLHWRIIALQCCITIIVCFSYI